MRDFFYGNFPSDVVQWLCQSIHREGALPFSPRSLYGGNTT